MSIEHENAGRRTRRTGAPERVRRADAGQNERIDEADDLFDDISLDDIDDLDDLDGALFDDDADDYDDAFRDYGEEDAIIGDSGMEDKIFRQAMRTDSDAARHKAGTSRAEGSAKRGPKELNTPGSAIDRKQISRERDQKKRLNIKKIVLWAVVELITICVIFGYGYFLRALSQIERPDFNKADVENNNLSLEKKKEMEGYWTIAIFGVDARDNKTLAKGTNTDVIMIASINMDTGDIKICSVFRDTYLNISDKNYYTKINAAYAQGGPQQALAALNKNLDLNITDYVTLNWKAVADGINILGGVDDVDISSAELYYINSYITDTVKGTGVGSVQLKHTGTQHLDGVQAVAYARLRYMDNDFVRTERQKIILKKAFEKAKKADFSVLNNILVVCLDNVATNISVGDMVRMAQGISKYKIAGTGGFPWSRGDANIRGGSMVIPTTLESNVAQLHEFLFGDTNYQPSSAVVKISQKIKEDSSLYKEGKPVESLRTDQGVIPKPKSSVSTVSGDDEEETTKKRVEYTMSTDENGDLVYPTNEDGDLVIPTDENGDVVYPTDADGNKVKPSQSRPAETRPTDLAEETEGDAGSELVDNHGNVISPGETRPTTAPTTSAAHSTKPSQTVGPQEETTAARTEHQTTAPTTSGSVHITDIPNEPVLVPQQTTGAQTSLSPGNAPGSELTPVTPGGNGPVGP